MQIISYAKKMILALSALDILHELASFFSKKIPEMPSMAIRYCFTVQFVESWLVPVVTSL